jgi:hypothetical protein
MGLIRIASRTSCDGPLRRWHSFRRGAELLFQIITEREERASIALGANLPFSEWGTVFPAPRLVAVLLGSAPAFATAM